MQGNEKEQEIDMKKLSNEITYRKYIMSRDSVRHLFSKLTVAEYVVLQSIMALCDSSDIYGGKAYLTDLSMRLQMTIRQTSKSVRDLRDRGLVKWSHDGNGMDGTYVTVTEAGEKLIREQENILKEFYTGVIDKYGKDKLVELLVMMKELDTVMESEIEDMNVVKQDEPEQGWVRTGTRKTG